MSAKSIDLRAFAEIVTTVEDTGRSIEAAMRGNKKPDLEGLRMRLRRRIDELDVKLDKLVSPSTLEEILIPLVVFLDERVQTRLAREVAARAIEVAPWPLLQRDLLDEGDGGDEFFERAEKLIREADPEPLVAATYIHCIDSGFVGRHFDEPEELKAWKEKLSRCLPKNASPVAPTKTLVASAKPTLRYVLLALSVVAGFHVVFALFALFK